MASRAWQGSSGRGSAAVMVCRPAWISMVRYRRAVLTNFLIVQPVCALDPAADGEGCEDDGEVGFDGVALAVVDRPGPRVRNP
jgi:hypothetical protein